MEENVLMRSKLFSTKASIIFKYLIFTYSWSKQEEEKTFTTYSNYVNIFPNLQKKKSFIK